MRFSVIGTGFISSRHFEAINYVKGEIVDVVNDFRSPNDWKGIVKKPEADCIVILTPNDLHYEMAMAVADEGKIVLCEKPLAIRVKQVEDLAKRENIFTVLQLRHHPIAKKLKKEIKKSEKYEIDMDISVYRDKDYYEGWQGQKERSGGVLFKIGIHYFDMLLYLFGGYKEVETNFLDDKTGYGTIKGKNYLCNWRVSTEEKKENQRRVFNINGEKYNFSSKDNLSYENLHREVYKDLLRGMGVTPRDVLETTILIEKLNKKEKWNI